MAEKERKKDAKKVLQQIEKLRKNTGMKNLDKLKVLEGAAENFANKSFDFSKF